MLELAFAMKVGTPATSFGTWELATAGERVLVFLEPSSYEGPVRLDLEPAGPTRRAE